MINSFDAEINEENTKVKIFFIKSCLHYFRFIIYFLKKHKFDEFNFILLKILVLDKIT